MRRFKIGQWLIGIGIALYYIENTYFGWNVLPESDFEADCDWVIKWILRAGAIFFTMPMFDIYRGLIKKYADKEEEEKDEQ